MQIISKRRFLFQHDNGKDEIIVNNIPHPQVVPEWVADTDLFKWSVDDGNVAVVAEQAVVPKPKAAPKVPTSTPVAEVVGGAPAWPTQADGLGGS